MDKPTFTVEEVERMMESPKQLPDPDSFEIEHYWVEESGDVWSEYHLEYQARRVRRLEREKLLLRAALQETIQELYRATMYTGWYVDTRWQERILSKTK